MEGFGALEVPLVDQSREGRENIPAGGTSHVKGERIYLDEVLVEGFGALEVPLVDLEGFLLSARMDWRKRIHCVGRDVRIVHLPELRRDLDPFLPPPPPSD